MNFVSSTWRTQEKEQNENNLYIDIDVSSSKRMLDLCGKRLCCWGKRNFLFGTWKERNCIIDLLEL